MGGLALGNFTLIVGKDIVYAAAVYVEGLAEIFGGHGGAFDMPAREALAPRAGPAQNMLRLSFFPQGKVGRMLFVFAYGDTSTLF